MSRKYSGIDVGRRFDRTAQIDVIAPPKFAVEDAIIIKTLSQYHGLRFDDQAAMINPGLCTSTRTCVDVSGLGQGLIECLVGVQITPIVIGYGFTCHRLRNGFWVGKHFLVQVCMAGISRSKSELSRNDERLLRQQLHNYVVKPGVKPKFEASIGHDDLVIALALAYLGEYIDDYLEDGPIASTTGPVEDDSPAASEVARFRDERRLRRFQRRGAQTHSCNSSEYSRSQSA